MMYSLLDTYFLVSTHEIQSYKTFYQVSGDVQDMAYSSVNVHADVCVCM